MDDCLEIFVRGELLLGHHFSELPKYLLKLRLATLEAHGSDFHCHGAGGAMAFKSSQCPNHVPVLPDGLCPDCLLGEPAFLQ